MTTFRHAARKPRTEADVIADASNPLANRHHQQREIRMNKIRMWARDPQLRPARPVAFVSGVMVPSLTYARANILKDVYNLTSAELVEKAVSAYCAMLVKKQPIEHEDKAIEAWVNGTEA